MTWAPDAEHLVFAHQIFIVGTIATAAEAEPRTVCIRPLLTQDIDTTLPRPPEWPRTFHGSRVPSASQALYIRDYSMTSSQRLGAIAHAKLHHHARVVISLRKLPGAVGVGFGPIGEGPSLQPSAGNPTHPLTREAATAYATLDGTYEGRLILANADPGEQRIRQLSLWSDLPDH